MVQKFFHKDFNGAEWNTRLAIQNWTLKDIVNNYSKVNQNMTESVFRMIALTGGTAARGPAAGVRVAEAAALCKLNCPLSIFCQANKNQSSGNFKLAPRRGRRECI